MIKLKYRLIKALAKLLRCEYIIDQDEYDSVIPRRIKPFKGKIPDGLLTFDDNLAKHLYGSSNVLNKISRESMLKRIEYLSTKPTGNTFNHYEEPNL